MACGPCATQVKLAPLADSHAAFSRAILFGIGAAFVGMIAYALFEIVTGIIIGYVAISVGYLVAKAMKLGSNGRGGRRYQIAAVLLTYASVSFAAIPVAVLTYKIPRQPKQHLPLSTPPANSKPPLDRSPTLRNSVPARNCSCYSALAWSPLLELANGFSGIISLFILFLGIRAAWSLTAGTDASAPDISGPYNAQPSTSNAV